MTGITTAMAASFKQELLQGGHCFNQVVTPTVTAASAATLFTAVSSTAGITLGMAITGTGVAASSFVSAITANASFVSSVATTAIISAAAVTLTGDTYKMALIKAPEAGTYSSSNVNYTDIGTDEVPNATGYTTTGSALTNVSPVINSTQAVVNFSPNPSWTTATFSTIGCMIYNTTARLGGSSGTGTNQSTGRACGVFDFGGTQTVSAGTFTVVMPGASSGSAILRIA